MVAAASSLQAPGVGGAWVSCYASFLPTGAPLSDVERLGKLCGAPLGMRPAGAVWEGDIDEKGAQKHEFSLRQGQCVRVFGVASAGVADLDLTLLDARGEKLGADRIDDAWPVLLPDRPCCLREGGVVTLRVSSRKGSGRYAAQAWVLP